MIRKKWEQMKQKLENDVEFGSIRKLLEERSGVCISQNLRTTQNDHTTTKLVS